jgi:hypothetical protein
MPEGGKGEEEEEEVGSAFALSVAVALVLGLGVEAALVTVEGAGGDVETTPMAWKGAQNAHTAQGMCEMEGCVCV